MRDSNLMKIDFVQAGKDRKRILELWQERFGSK